MPCKVLLNPASLLVGNPTEENIEAFLSAVQFAFVQGLEVVLLGAFAIMPIVVALLVTSQGGQALTNWVSGIVGLYASQLIYNVTTGVISLFLIEKDIMTTTRIDALTFQGICVFHRTINSDRPGLWTVCESSQWGTLNCSFCARSKPAGKA